jgi:hypothetical protein
MTSSSKLGLKIVINNEEKDLDDIFLKITDYNNSVINGERQSGEAVQLMQNTGIKYIDENNVKRDLIDRYIGYDSEGYIADNYEADPSRVDVSDLNAITDICGNNLVNLFYQLGTKKKNTSSDYKSYIIHNKNKQVKFDMKFLQDVRLSIELLYQSNYIQMRYNSNNIISISGNSVTIETSSTSSIVDIKNTQTSDISTGYLKFMIDGSDYISKSLGSETEVFPFDKDTDTT